MILVGRVACFDAGTNGDPVDSRLLGGPGSLCNAPRPPTLQALQRLLDRQGQLGLHNKNLIALLGRVRYDR